MSVTAMKQALEALYPISHNNTDDYRGQADKAITSLRQAIEQAEKQEPVAVARVDDLERGGRVRALAMGLALDAPLYHAPQPQQAEKQKPDTLRHIEEGHCLLDVDERAWRLIVENRGGCRCYRSPPCFACSEPISEEEMNEVGYTYTTPQPQREWVGLTDEERNHARHTVTYSQLAMTAGEWAEAVQIETEKRLKEKNT